jgi:phosphoribosylformylglycinamidine synthase
MSFQEGIASAIGEQPIKGLVNTAAGARMTVAESLSNLVFALISDIRDVKCSGNWMWAAKLPGEGAALFDACKAMCDMMNQIGVAIDGGKDSLSMAARVGRETVKAPGTLVVSTYAPCPDVRKVVTPDLKVPATGKSGHLLFVDLSHGYSRVGGAAVAQVFGQLGKECADVQNAQELRDAFVATQELIRDGAVQAGHDVSDGGLIVCLLEMCFAGISGMEVQVTHRQGKTIPILFSEEVGWVLEVLDSDVKHCLDVFKVDKKKQSTFSNVVIPETQSAGLQDWEERRVRRRRQNHHICQQRVHRELSTATDAHVGRDELQTGTAANH